MILPLLLAEDAWSIAVSGSALIYAVSNVRFAYNSIGEYIVQACCFNYLTTETDYGGAISIINETSNVNADFSSFVNCSAMDGGGIYSNCLNLQVNRCKAEGCSIKYSKGCGSFLFIDSQNFSSKVISVHGCPIEPKALGIGSIFFRSSKCDACMSSLNSTYNFNTLEKGCALSIGGVTSFSLDFSLISQCESEGNGPLVHISLTQTSRFGTTSFINNTLFLLYNQAIVYTYNCQYTTFYRCVFAGNQKSHTFQINKGNITLRECFFDEKENFGDNITAFNVSWGYREAFPISTISLGLCTQRITATATTNNKLSGGAIAGIAIGSSAAVISVVGYVSYRLYTKNSAAARRLRNLDMAESLITEFG